VKKFFEVLEERGLKCGRSDGAGLGEEGSIIRIQGVFQNGLFEAVLLQP
jgi:hypothetical protein